ncbi:hypothetical protein ABZ802_20145 [Streptomyces sp. NPDC047737]|uniref:hypothetical protein n=1 Tax=unclassified Streptomyces TaxID=2593676 RepID=UPI0033CC1205
MTVIRDCSSRSSVCRLLICWLICVSRLALAAFRASISWWIFCAAATESAHASTCCWSTTIRAFEA